MRRFIGTAAILLVLVASAFAQQVHYVSGFTISPVTGCIWVVQPSGSPPDRKLCNPNFLNAIGLMQVSANTMDGNWLSGSAVDRHHAMPSCSDGQGWLIYVTSTGISCGGVTATDVVSAAPQNVSTASLTPVMAGIGQQGTPPGAFNLFLNPIGSGNYLVTISGWMQGSTNLDGIAVQLYWGTGTAPAAGAAVPGGAHAIGKSKTVVNVGNNMRAPFRTQAYTTGVSGCPCWVDLAINAVTGGTGSAFTLSAFAMER